MAHLFGRTYGREELLDLVGDMSQVAGVRRAELIEGNERGAGLIEIANASGLACSLLPGRALDIASASYRGMSLCFRGNTGDVGPAFYEPPGYGWMRGFFGGLLTTCGMTFVGHPEVDPEEEDEELGLHGRLSFLPAKQVRAGGRWQGDDYVLEAEGRIREAVVFGTCLEMSRTVSTTLGERSIRIHDRVENLAAERSPLMILYHMNPGFPLLDAGARLLVRSQRSTRWRDDREVGPEVYAAAAPPPRPGADDVVYVHRPIADADGMATAAFVNERMGLGLRFRFPLAEIPLLTQWQRFATRTYVTGIEPGNCSPLGRAWNRANGSLRYIEPGEVHEFHMEIAVLDGADELAAAEREIGG